VHSGERKPNLRHRTRRKELRGLEGHEFLDDGGKYSWAGESMEGESSKC